MSVTQIAVARSRAKAKRRAAEMDLVQNIRDAGAAENRTPSGRSRQGRLRQHPPATDRRTPSICFCSEQPTPTRPAAGRPRSWPKRCAAAIPGLSSCCWRPVRTRRPSTAPARRPWTSSIRTTGRWSRSSHGISGGPCDPVTCAAAPRRSAGPGSPGPADAEALQSSSRRQPPQRRAGATPLRPLQPACTRRADSTPRHPRSATGPIPRGAPAHQRPTSRHPGASLCIPR